MAISVGTTTITFNDSTTQSTAATSYSSPSPNIQTFNATGTWTKPTGDYRMARIQLWGGGSGAAYNSGPTGGGGGAYNEVTVPFSYIATQTVTVGGGGAGGSTGAAGGTSSVTVTASSASNGRATISAPGAPANTSSTYYGPGASLVASDTGYYWNGGYGGWSWEPSTIGAAMGSTWGGGGGGAYYPAGSGPYIAPGSSYYGGSGGEYNSAGTVPGGGGGCYTSSPRAGASGRVVITCY